MATRYPLVIDTSDGNKIKELPNGDNLNLTGNNIVNVVNVTATGALSVSSVEVTSNTFTVNGNSLNTVAFTGNYADLTGAPTTFNGNYNNLTNKPTLKTTIESLDNVSTTAPTNNQVLQYDSSTGTYKPSSIASVSASSIDALLDVNVSNIASAAGQILKWDGSAWIRGNASSGQDADTLDSYEGTYYLNYNNFTNKPNVLASVTADDTDTFTATSNTDNFKIYGGTGVTTSILNDVVTITNSAPDQTVAFTNGTNITVTGTYPNFTIASTALAGISVGTPATPNSSGSIAYNAGVITFTPPDLSGYITNTGVLSSHTDVATTTPNVGEVLKWSGSTWEPSDDSIQDIKGSVFGDDSTLLVDGVNSKLYLGANNLAELANVDTTAPTDGQVLKWSGTAWAPAADGGGSGGGTLVEDVLDYNASSGANSLSVADGGYVRNRADTADIKVEITIPAGSTKTLVHLSISAGSLAFFTLQRSIAGGTYTDVDTFVPGETLDAVDTHGASAGQTVAYKIKNASGSAKTITYSNGTVQTDCIFSVRAVGVTTGGSGGSGDIEAVTAGTGLTGGGTTGSVTLNVDVGTTANKIVQIDSTGKLPAIDGSQLTNISGGGGGSLTVQEEGSSLSTAASVINFVGAGVTATGAGSTKTVTIPAGSTDLNSLNAATIDTDNDSIAFVDANDANTSKRVSIQNFLEAIKGTGLGRTNGQLTVTGLTVQEEGSDTGDDATVLNFVGTGVTATGTGSTKTITITGSGGSGFTAGNNLDQANANLRDIGYLSYRSSSATPTKILTVTVGTQGAEDYYNTQGSSNKYRIDGDSSPFLSLAPGIYRFDQADNTNANHPLRFYEDPAKTTQYTTGVTNSGTPGSSGAYTQITIDKDTKTPLYYQCSSHAYMGHGVEVVGGTDNTGGSSTVTVQEEGSSLSTAATTLNFVGAGVTAAGTGTTKTITVPAGTDINSLASAVIDTTADSFAFSDANDSNNSKKESVTDFLVAIAGTNLVHNNGQLDTSGVLTDVLNDASPQLGGDLDVNGRQLKYTFNITASGSNHYIFNDTNNLFFSSSGENDPTLYLQRGNSYVFNNTSGGHPLAFKTPDGTAYTTGVTTYNTNGKTFNIPMNAPPLLYYYCTSHAAMQGKIYIDGDDLNSVAEAAIDTANDKIAFIDDSDPDKVTKKEAIPDFLEAIKGTGLGRSGGQLTATNTFVGLTDTPSAFAGSAADANKFVKVNGSGSALVFDTLTANSINDTHIDFGTGTNQVNTDDLTEGSTNLYYTDARAQAISINALSEDAAPSLGANLTAGSHNISMASGNLVMGSGNITSVTNQDIDIDPHGTGKVTVGSNLNITGTLQGPSSFTIDPAAYGDNTGTVIIAGNLQVDGTTTTINSTTLDVDDLNITVAKGAADAAAANGAGLTVDGAAATFTYASSGDKWVANKQIFAKNASGAEVDLSAAAANAATTGKAIAMAMVFG